MADSNTRSISFYRDLFILASIFISLVIITFEIAYTHTISLDTSIIIYLIDIIMLIELLRVRRSQYAISEAAVSAFNEVQGFKRWFPIDLLANLPFDLLLLIVLSDASWAGTPIILWVRLFRMLRISRAMRIFRGWERMPDNNSSAVRVSRFVVSIAFMTHLVSCAWYYSSYITGFNPESWVSRLGLTESALIDVYIRSIYWTVTTMTAVGYGDITPAWRAEYIIAMIVMLMGAYVYAYIIGNVASLLSNLDAAKAGHRQRMAVISQYLKLQHVPISLTNRVHEYYELAWKRNKGLLLREIFTDLPKPLMKELTEHIALPVLSDIPFFKSCSSPLQTRLMSVLKFETYPPDTIIGKAGELGDAIYFIRSGEIAVLSEPDAHLLTTLKSKDHFGELSMLLKEERTVTTRTLTFCEVLVLEYQDFLALKTEFPEIKVALSNTSSAESNKKAEMLLKNIVL